MDGAQPFISLCRPQPKPCECLQLERDSVSLALLAGIRSRLGQADCKKVVGRVAQASEFLLPIPELWVPRPCVFFKGGYDAADSASSAMLVVAVNVGWGSFRFAIVRHKEHSLFSSRDTRYAKSGAPTIVIPSAAKRLGHPRFPVFLEK
jgi:hypothetical protein